jgi:beta-glucosidase
MNHKLRMLLLCLIAGLFVVASAKVTGRVVDGSGKPVADAMVMYTKPDNHLIYVYSDQLGRFALPGPSEWSLKDPPMYKPVDAVIGVAGKNSARSNGFLMSAAGDNLRLSLSSFQSITISLFGINGRKIASIPVGALKPGLFQINPFSSVNHAVAHQACIVQVSNGNEARSLRIVYQGDGGAGAKGLVSSGVPSVLVKEVAASIDSVRAGKTNFTGAYRGIAAYSVDIGDIAITARDIEAEITTLMTNRSTSWKGQEVTMGVDYNTQTNWGTIFYGAGNAGDNNNPTNLSRADKDDSWQTAAQTTMGIPKLIAIDAVRGYQSPPGGTFFPHNIGMGCTVNPLLIELEERVCATELRAMGVNWVFAPCIDVPRNEHWGRTYEGWDEGPTGSVPCVRAAIRGFQGTDLGNSCVVAACAKHFVGSGGTNGGQNAGNAATGTDAQLCAVHLPSFKAAVNAGTATVMASMCSWQGNPMHGYKRLLTDTLKTGWNWDGMICGDWGSSNGVGLSNSFAAGVDNMMNIDGSGPAGAYAAVVLATAARLDEACKRVLRVKYRLDLINTAKARRDLLPFVGADLHKQVARECVRRSMVLLKNDPVAAGGKNVLPFDPAAKIAIVGDFADNMWMQCGGWTLGWPYGLQNNPKWSTPPPGTTLKAGIMAACPNAVYLVNSTAIPADAAAVVVCVGEQPYAEGGGDAPGSQPFNLTAAHKALISGAAASGKPVVVVMYSGRPLIITDDIAKCKGWLQAWLPGTEGGGIADILFSVNGEKPTGKLSHTWPATEAQVPVNYNDPAGNPYGDATGAAGTPLFPYHFGLTY